MISKNETLLGKGGYYRYEGQYIEKKLIFNPTHLKLGKTAIYPNIIVYVYHLIENELWMSKIKQWFRDRRGDLLYREKHKTLRFYHVLPPAVTIGKASIYVENVFRDKTKDKLKLITLYFMREIVADTGLLYEWVKFNTHRGI